MTSSRTRRLRTIFIIALMSVAAVAFVAWAVSAIAIARARSGEYCGLKDVSRLAAQSIFRKQYVPPALVRQDGNLSLVRMADGTEWWVPKRGPEIPIMIREQTDVYESDLAAIQAGDVVLDCGANIGLVTQQALAAGARLVVSIEPAPENVECLRRNLAREIAAGRAVIYPKGVWDRKAEMRLEASGVTSARDRLDPSASTGTVVELTTIDELVAELKLERVDFIKMDIEGAERQALRGAQRTVAKWHPRMAISLEHSRSDLHDIPAQMRQQWPFLQIRCGPCVLVSNLRSAQPAVLFAR